MNEYSDFSQRRAERTEKQVGKAGKLHPNNKINGSLGPCYLPGTATWMKMQHTSTLQHRNNVVFVQSIIYLDYIISMCDMMNMIIPY